MSIRDSFEAAPASLQEALQRAALDFPTKGITIFDARGRRSERRSYTELYEMSRAFAARFGALGVEQREPVLVALPTSWQWMEAWLGVLMRGGWPVAISAAGLMAADTTILSKIEAVMERLGARRVIGSASLRAQAVQGGFERMAAGLITPEELAETTVAGGVDAPRPEPDDIAFLQLTSGSTGLPRAVMIPHRGAIHNPLASSEAIGAPRGGPVQRWADAMVAWLPMYHDMGLIGCLMLPILTGIDSFLLRPETFLARPRLWLEELARRGTTFVPAPNFSYQLCVERLAEGALDSVDLSSWRAALTGAEMVRPETVRAFCERFAPNGFDPCAFLPCYGLAEATLAVTFDTRGQGARTVPVPAGADTGLGLTEVVSTGGPVRDTSVEIVTPDGRTCAEGVVGEVRIQGPGVFLGYYNDPEATAQSLRGGWFHTGDLGFMKDGELYLTGRTKDVLIIRGQNLMPDDLERLADGVTGGGGMMRSAAFSVASGVEGEQAVMVVEVVDRDPETLSRLDTEIRKRVGRVLSLVLADVVFVRRGRIPRTTSGKMRRMELRQRYLDGELERLESDPATS
jgi:acyl-CoA synthetase (AMP-forming)/AMP-acid ligase II